MNMMPDPVLCNPPLLAGADTKLVMRGVEHLVTERPYDEAGHVVRELWQKVPAGGTKTHITLHVLGCVWNYVSRMH